MSKTFSISNLDPTMADQVGTLHSLGIMEGFLSTLGNRFLTKLYIGISKAENSGVLVATVDDEVLGFVSYSKDIGQMFKNVIKSNFFALSFALLPQLFRLSIYMKIIETVLYPFRKKREQTKVEKEVRVELLSIVVSAKARGKGVGKALVAALDEKFKELGVDCYYVVTHAIDEQSNSFYRSCGFQLVGTFENHSKPMNEYRKVLRTKC